MTSRRRIAPLYTLKVEKETIKLAQAFTIARDSRDHVEVVLVTLHDPKTSVVLGKGEARAYARYNETPDSVIDDIEQCRQSIEAGKFPDSLHAAAANAVNCALIDAQCTKRGRPIADALAIKCWPDYVITGNTISLDTPDAMATQTRKLLANGAHILKIKLGSNEDGQNLTRLRRIVGAVKAHGVPDVKLSVDFNEGCVTMDGTPDIAHANDVIDFGATNGIQFLEQPFPEKYDHEDAPARLRYPVTKLDKKLPILADESYHTEDSLESVLGICGYRGINMKLAKTGGLKNGVAMVDHLIKHYPEALLSIGSMASSSLSAAADYSLVAYAMDRGAKVAFVDIDSPTLVGPENDRAHAMRMEGSKLFAPPPELWGGGKAIGYERKPMASLR